MPPKPPPIAAVMNPKLKTLLTTVSLFLIATIPITLTTATISKFSSNIKAYESHPKPQWLPLPFPSLSTIHSAETASTLLMSVAAALVCVDGGFFDSETDALPFYLIQIVSSVLWDPVVLSLCDADIGVIFCAANFVAVLCCYFVFGEVNRSSKYFVMPCLVWAGFLLFLTFLIAPRVLFFEDDDLKVILL